VNASSVEPGDFRHQASAEILRVRSQPLIRAANFHNTPRYREKEFQQQLQHWSDCFSSVNETELDGYLSTGAWHKPRPGLIIGLYNGYRNQYDVMLPLLERYGFVGWYFVPTAFVGTPAAEQAAFVATRTLKIIPDEYSDGRYALNWNELKTLDRNHVVACHTRNHARIADDPAYLRNEIVAPQQDFEQHLGHRVRSFAWLSGSAYGDHPASDRLIDAAQYQFVFSNYAIQKVRVADTPPAAR
jgi:hypothetical protein